IPPPRWWRQDERPIRTERLRRTQKHAHRPCLVADEEPAVPQGWRGPAQPTVKDAGPGQLLIGCGVCPDQDQAASVIEQDQLAICRQHGCLADPVRLPAHLTSQEIETLEAAARRPMSTGLELLQVE